MSVTLSHSKASYLAQVAEGLTDLPREDREEVLQDLEAHLIELADDSVQKELGTPQAFVLEFRQSAGLTHAGTHQGLVGRSRAKLDEWSSRLSDVTRWPSMRPAWIWVRGWLLITAWSLLYYADGFGRFPIPRFGSSTLTGLLLVITATWLSVWLERGRASRAKTTASKLFSVIATLALIGTLLNPYPGPSIEAVDDSWAFTDRLTTADGETIDNIYAYDVKGNPVEVLLFDAYGRPIKTLPLYVYDDAELQPGKETIAYDNGSVTFSKDQFGRVIPNLYPLSISTYDEYGRLTPMPTPSLGFPSPDESETDGTQTTNTTPE